MYSTHFYDYSTTIFSFLMLQLMNMRREEQELEASYVTVYTLNRNVDSGEEVSEQAETHANIKDEVPIKSGPIPETLCVAIKKRMSSCSCFLSNYSYYKL